MKINLPMRVSIADEIDLGRDMHIPPLILQPYIENAIRHGIGHPSG